LEREDCEQCFFVSFDLSEEPCGRSRVFQTPAASDRSFGGAGDSGRAPGREAGVNRRGNLTANYANHANGEKVPPERHRLQRDWQFLWTAMQGPHAGMLVRRALPDRPCRESGTPLNPNSEIPNGHLPQPLGRKDPGKSSPHRCGYGFIFSKGFALQWLEPSGHFPFRSSG